MTTETLLPKQNAEATIKMLKENEGKFFDLHFKGENQCAGFAVTSNGDVCPLFEGNHTLNPLYLMNDKIVLSRMAIGVMIKDGVDWESGFKTIEQRSPGFIKEYHIFGE